MKKKFKFLYVFISLIFISIPVYGSGYEDISLFKIILQLIFYLVIFVAVILLSIYGTKFIAKNYKKVVSSKYMDLIDILTIPGGSKLAIVKVNNNVYILSISNNGTTVIDKLNKDEFHTLEDNFDNYLDKYLGKWNNNLKTNRILSKFYFNKDKEDMKDETKD